MKGNIIKLIKNNQIWLSNLFYQPREEPFWFAPINLFAKNTTLKETNLCMVNRCQIGLKTIYIGFSSKISLIFFLLNIRYLCGRYFLGQMNFLIIKIDICPEGF